MSQGKKEHQRLNYYDPELHKFYSRRSFLSQLNRIVFRTLVVAAGYQIITTETEYSLSKRSAPMRRRLAEYFSNIKN